MIYDLKKKPSVNFIRPNCGVTSPYETKGEVKCNSALISLPFSQGSVAGEVQWARFAEHCEMQLSF